MKKVFRGLLCFLLIGMFITTFCETVWATNGIKHGKALMGQTVTSCGEYENEEELVQAFQNGEYVPTISKEKYLFGFDNEIYIIRELEGYGYIILDEKDEHIIEYSLSAPSPYQGYETNLYYFGPTCYYYLYNDIFYHTIIDEIIDSKDTELMLLLKNKARAMNNNMSTGGFKGDCKSTGNVLITHANQIYSMTTSEQMGYRDGGICGYISKCMCLLYLDLYDNDFVINNFTFRKGTMFCGGLFSKKLRSYGSSNGTWSHTFYNTVLPSFANSHYLTLESELTNPLLQVTVFTKMKQWISEYDVPVSIDGRFPASTSSGNTGSHSITAFGYNDSYVHAHYGWPEYNYVIFDFNYASFEEAICIKNATTNTVPISDISTSNWAYEPAVFCLRYGYLNYINGTSFKPTDPTTRIVFVNALYQVAGAPDVSDSDLLTLTSTFTDISSVSEPYLSALAWAYREGVISGTSPTTADPNGSLTREQAVTIIYSFINSLTTSTSHISFTATNGPQASTFPDYNNVALYARIPMNFATKRYLIAGSNGYLKPKDVLTRNQIAAIIRTLSMVAYRDD